MGRVRQCALNRVQGRLQPLKSSRSIETPREWLHCCQPFHRDSLVLLLHFMAAFQVNILCLHDTRLPISLAENASHVSTPFCLSRLQRYSIPRLKRHLSNRVRLHVGGQSVPIAGDLYVPTGLYSYVLSARCRFFQPNINTELEFKEPGSFGQGIYLQCPDMYSRTFRAYLPGVVNTDEATFASVMSAPLANCIPEYTPPPATGTEEPLIKSEESVKVTSCDPQGHRIWTAIWLIKLQQELWNRVSGVIAEATPAYARSTLPVVCAGDSLIKTKPLVKVTSYDPQGHRIWARNWLTKLWQELQNLVAQAYKSYSLVTLKRVDTLYRTFMFIFILLMRLFKVVTPMEPFLPLPREGVG